VSPAEQAAAKMLTEAIAVFKNRVRDEAMSLKPVPENDEMRRALVSQFHVADDVGKTIAAQTLRKS
jgi:hypothetical protein